MVVFHVQTSVQRSSTANNDHIHQLGERRGAVGRWDACEGGREIKPTRAELARSLLLSAYDMLLSYVHVDILLP